MSLRSTHAPALGLAIFALAVPRVVFADERADARRHFRAGIADASQHAYVQAVAEFQRAYEILPNPDVLYNIARAYSDAGDLDHAVEYYRRYLEGDISDRGEIESLVRDLDARRRASVPVPSPTGPTGTSTVAAPTRPTIPGTPSVNPPAGLTSEQLHALHDAAETLLRYTEGTAPAAATASTVPATQRPAGGTLAPRREVLSGTPRSAPGGDTYEERVVTATLSAQSPLDAPYATSVITQQDIRLSGLTSVPELLRRAVGVDVMELEGSDYQVGIRGFNSRLSNRVLVLVDGRSVYLDFLGVTLWGALPVNVEEIDRIEIIRGPGSALYGADAFSGVVNIITRAPGDGRSSVTLSAGNQLQLRTTYTGSGRTGGIAYRTSVGYEQAGAYSNPVSSVDPAYRITAPSSDLSLQSLRADIDLRAQISRTVSIRGGVSGSRSTDWFNAIGPLREFWADLTLVQPWVQVTAGGFDARAFVNHVSATSAQLLQQVGTSALDSRVQQDVADLELRYVLDSHLGSVENSLTFGGSYRMKYISWSFLDADHRLDFFAGFVQDQARFNDWLSAVLALRIDQHPVLDAPVPSLRGSLVVKPSARRSLRLSGSTAFRTPTFLELYLDLPQPTAVPGVTVTGQGGEVYANGSQRLRAENALSFDIGFQDQTSDRFQYELGAYYIRGTDLIGLTNVSFDHLPGVSSPNQSLDVGTLHFANDPFATEVYGAEITARLSPVDGLDIYGNATFTGTSHDDNSVLMGDQRTPTAKFNLGAQWRTSLGIDVEADLHYVSSEVWMEQDYAPVQGVVYNTYYLPDYATLDARVGYRVPGDHLELGLVGTNLTDNRHREHPFGVLLGARVMAVVGYRY